MIVIQITHHILPEHVDRYIEATMANAQATRREVGNVRFDVLRDATEPCSFQLYEAYVDRQAQRDHLESAHFLVWREAVEDVFAGRSIHKFEALHVP